MFHPWHHRELPFPTLWSSLYPLKIQNAALCTLQVWYPSFSQFVLSNKTFSATYAKVNHGIGGSTCLILKHLYGFLVQIYLQARCPSRLTAKSVKSLKKQYLMNPYCYLQLLFNLPIFWKLHPVWFSWVPQRRTVGDCWKQIFTDWTLLLLPIQQCQSTVRSYESTQGSKIDWHNASVRNTDLQ